MPVTRSQVPRFEHGAFSVSPARDAKGDRGSVESRRRAHVERGGGAAKTSRCRARARTTEGVYPRTVGVVVRPFIFGHTMYIV